MTIWCFVLILLTQVASVSSETDQGVSLCQGSQDTLLVSMKSALYLKDTSSGNNSQATEVTICCPNLLPH